MSDFIRRTRYVKYGNKTCKRYLRFDFNYKCAYCHTSEAEIISGHKYFEIDHFKPQSTSDNTYDVHQYNNLFYSCVICNGPEGKSDKWNIDLLNPCIHVIFGEHISKEIGNDYKIAAITPEGHKYIETFKLNQKSQRRIRLLREENLKRLEQRSIEILEIVEKLKVLKGNKEVPNNLIESLEQVIHSFEIEKYGPYFNNLSIQCLDTADEAFFEKRMSEYGAFSKVYNDFDVDYEFIINGEKSLCYHRLFKEINLADGGEKQIRIHSKQVADWIENSTYPIVLVAFSAVDEKVYLKRLSNCLQEKPLDLNRKYYVAKLTDEDLLDKEQVMSCII